MRRAALAVLSCALAALGTTAAPMLREWMDSYEAYRRLGDPVWQRTATPREARETAERSLAWPFGDEHEAFLLLEGVGDRSSIPALRRAYARRPRGDRLAACTWGHGRDALAKLLAMERCEDGRDPPLRPRRR